MKTNIICAIILSVLIAACAIFLFSESENMTAFFASKLIAVALGYIAYVLHGLFKSKNMLQGTIFDF